MVVGFCPSWAGLSSGSKPSGGKSICSEVAGVAASICLGVGLATLPVDVHHASASVLSEDTLFRRYIVTSGEALLRYSLPLGPAEDKLDIRKLQRILEDIDIDLRSKGPIALRSAKKDIENIQAALAPGKQLNLALDVPRAKREKAFEEIQGIASDVDSMSKAFDAEVKRKNSAKGAFRRGSVDIPRESALVHVANIETMMAPSKLPYRIPSRYKELPRLVGRASVDLEVRKGSDSSFMSKDGKKEESVVLTAIVDGYSAPLSAGNFVDLVNRGHYDGEVIVNRIRGLFALTGGEGGFIESGKRREIPLELKLDGDPSPIWGETLDQAGLSEVPLSIPPSAYGAIAFVHSEGNPNDGSSQFCFYIKDPRSMEARSRYGGIENGNVSTFGYVVVNEQYLSQLEKGDVIVKARVSSGLENLQRSEP
ncbi:hypothetical protein NDN08_004378 [Rhodosorus marinus]|uniref:peptidylprolyl isomerase n=1 Tax=Rhodosorus marinus TaxID=101924 RepID=A0AAV8ULJ2_9RHOD|nr:hypothetical protein NDN08_004378 [Rhodosorus marinus]